MYKPWELIPDQKLDNHREKLEKIAKEKLEKKITLLRKAKEKRNSK